MCNAGGQNQQNSCSSRLAFQTSGNNIRQKTCFNPRLEIGILWLFVGLLGAMVEIFTHITAGLRSFQKAEGP